MQATPASSSLLEFHRQVVSQRALAQKNIAEWQRESAFSWVIFETLQIFFLAKTSRLAKLLEPVLDTLKTLGTLHLPNDLFDFFVHRFFLPMPICQAHRQTVPL
jgi:hypothetical protein